jgi:hypothetical protein
MTRDSHKQFDVNTTYTIPTSGIYTFSSNLTRAIHTGEFHWVKNESRKWFQFWKPKLVYKEILTYIDVPCHQTFYTEKNDVINLKDIRINFLASLGKYF